jgi:hypothetical protein
LRPPNRDNTQSVADRLSQRQPARHFLSRARRGLKVALAHWRGFYPPKSRLRNVSREISEVGGRISVITVHIISFFVSLALKAFNCATK